MPTVEQIERYRYLLPYRFYCDDDQCDGMPHIRMPHKHARAKQRPPTGDWDVWALISGRGFGKTRSGAEYVKDRILSFPGSAKANRALVVAPTLAVARDVCVKGESGLIAVTPPDRIKGFNQQTQELVFTNGGIVKLFGADDLEDADRIRGYQSHTAWFEELATQRYQQVAWDNAAFANRLGTSPRTVVTATPRPTVLVKKILRNSDHRTILTTGNTFENEANLADAFVRRLHENYVGTRLEAQELNGELVEDVTGALLTREDITIAMMPRRDQLIRVVIGVDPAGSHKTTGAETGIHVVGMDRNNRCYVLEDLSGRYDAGHWGRVVVEAYHDWDADLIVPERNFGGDMVISTIRTVDANVNIKTDLVASKSKQVRAEPIAALYRRTEVVHVGNLPELEDMWCGWVPPGQFEVDKDGSPIAIAPSDYSPDRIDSVVWAVTELRGLTGKRVQRTRMRFSA